MAFDQDVDSQMRELDELATLIRSKVPATHMNVRIVWYEILLPTIEGARRAARCTHAKCRAHTGRVLEALRDFARTL